MGQRYVGIGRVGVVGTGETIDVQMCNGCGGLVINTTKHDAFHVKLGDDVTRRIPSDADEAAPSDGAKFSVNVGPDPRRGLQFGNGNVQNNVFPGRPT